MLPAECCRLEYMIWMGNLDEPGSSAQFDYLLSITMDAVGAIYLAQSDGPVRKIVIH
jgi:hypothetical protein